MVKTTEKELSIQERRDIALLECMCEGLADFIGEADKMSERIRAICADHQNWDDGAAYTLDDAARKVGVVLAAITNWRRDVTGGGDGE